MASLRIALNTVLIGISWPMVSFAAPPASAAATPSLRAAPMAETAPAHDRDGSQDEGPPVLLDRAVDVGGYVGLDVGYTRMFGQDGAVVGLQGALLFGHRFSLGVAGYGWTNAQPGPNDSLGREQRFETGYGGATLHYSLFFADFPAYLTFGALIGGGGVVLTPDRSDDFDDLDSNDDDADVFALVQPDLTLNVNVTRWMRVGLTAGYRLTSGVDQYGFDESDVNGVVLGGQVQIGRF